MNPLSMNQALISRSGRGYIVTSTRIIVTLKPPTARSGNVSLNYWRRLEQQLLVLKLWWTSIRMSEILIEYKRNDPLKRLCKSESRFPFLAAMAK